MGVVVVFGIGTDFGGVEAVLVRGLGIAVCLTIWGLGVGAGGAMDRGVVSVDPVAP